MSTHSSAHRIAANQANSTHSTGPNTDAGKAVSSRNALTTGLTGRTVLLPVDDKDRYDRHLAAHRSHYQPANDLELSLVQSIADTAWRLERIPGLLLAIEAKGVKEAAAENADESFELLNLEAYLRYEKQIRNLQLQEFRLHRRHEKDIAALRTLQKERADQQKQELETAARLYLLAQAEGKPFAPADHGFEFSTAEIDTYLAKLRGEQLMKQHLARPAAAQAA